MKFSWDENKNKTNIKKHKVSFDEASSVFVDINALTVFDKDASVSEDRFLIIGRSFKINILFVVFVEKIESEVRIISARKATKKERTKYEEKR